MTFQGDKVPGRYLLIEFDDEQSASRLRAQIDAATRNGKKFRVVGLFARPGKPCTCFLDRTVRPADQVKRGGRFGWWVCTTCGKPRLGDHQLLNILGPTEILEPAVLEGVDTRYTFNPGVHEFIRQISSMTFPLAVAKAKPE